MKPVSPSLQSDQAGQALGRLDDLVAVVIDDSDAVRLTLSLMLEDLGVGQVERASGGVEGLDVVGRLAGKACMVFCDLAMPDMDGVEVVRELHRRGHRVGVVLISGRDRRVLEVVSDVARQTGLDLVGALRKPFSRDEVWSMLTKWAAPRRMLVSALEERALTPQEILAAIENHRVEVVFEPQVPLKGDAPVVLEALARIRTPEEMIRPGRFIAVAEQQGLIEALTDRVVERALAHLAGWRRGGWNLHLSVNLSPLLLVQPGMPERLAAAAMRAGVPPSAVMIELTETVTEELTLVIESLARFRLKDFRLAIDDFGTGQSTLDRLHRMPFTDLKIDRTFVTGASTSPDKQTIIESSIQMAHRLDLQVTAEGIETEADEALVRQFGCDMGQGYYYTKPVSAEEVERLLPRWCPPAAVTERHES